jgi:hypothetical protein
MTLGLERVLPWRCSGRSRAVLRTGYPWRGRLAQLGERLPYKQEVAGSNPAPPMALVEPLRELRKNPLVQGQGPRYPLTNVVCPGGAHIREVQHSSRIERSRRPRRRLGYPSDDIQAEGAIELLDRLVKIRELILGYTACRYGA